MYMSNSCTPMDYRKYSTSHMVAIAAMSLYKTVFVLYRHLQPLEELTESVMKIMTKRLLRFQSIIREQLLISCCENMI